MSDVRSWAVGQVRADERCKFVLRMFDIFLLSFLFYVF